MIWGILGGVVLLLLLLLHLPVRIIVRYRNGDIAAQARWLFLRFPLYPSPEKKKKQEAAPEPEKEKPAKQKPDQSFHELLKTLNDLLPSIAESAGMLLRHLSLSKCRVALVVARGDPAETAFAVGAANALLYTVYPLLANHIKVREFKTDVRPDYEAASGSAEALAVFGMPPFFALRGGLRFLRRGGAALLNKQKITKKDR